MLGRICHDHVDLEPHEVGRHLGREVVPALRPAHVDIYVAVFDPAKFAEPRGEGGEPHAGRRLRAGAEEPNSHGLAALLRTRRDRPRRCAAEQRDELATFHSITSSVRASTVAGKSRPSALAVLRLMTNSYLVGACTGRSAGFSPLRMRST